MVLEATGAPASLAAPTERLGSGGAARQHLLSQLMTYFKPYLSTIKSEMLQITTESNKDKAWHPPTLGLTHTLSQRLIFNVN